MRYSARTVQAIDRWIFWGLVLIVGALPVLVYGTELRNVSPLITGIGPIDTGMFANSYIMIKFGFLVLMTLALAALFGYKLTGAGQSLEPDPIHIPLSAFVLLILASLMASPFPTVALAGYYDLKEGTITFLAYAALLLLSAHIAYQQRDLKYFIYAMVPFAVINGLLSILQLYGVNPMAWAWVRSFMYPPSVKTVPDYIQFATTLGNRNYSAGYSGMATATLLMAALLTRESTLRNISLATAFLTFASVVAALSESGFVTLVLVSPLIALGAWRFGSGRQTARTGLIAAVGLVLIFALANAANPSVWPENMGFFNELYHRVAGPASPGPSNPAPAATAPTPAQISGDLPVIPAPAWAFGTGRGYIWKRSLEVAMQRPLLGWGLDTISYAFPQHDLEKVSGVNSASTIITKPHSYYVALIFGAGIPAFLAFATLVGVVAWRALRRIFRSREIDPVLGALIIGLVAYLIQALVNDSMIGYSAVFWILLGTTAALLRADQAAVALTAGQAPQRTAAAAQGREPGQAAQPAAVAKASPAPAPKVSGKKGANRRGRR